MRGPLTVAALSLMTACAALQYQPAGYDTITQAYSVDGGQWDTGNGITTVTRIFERDGATIVCGAWVADFGLGPSYGHNDEVMEAASVYAGGTRLVQDLGFMPELAKSRDVTGEQARCVRSAVPWQADFAQTGPDVTFAPIQVGDQPEEDGGGDMIRFRDAQRASILG